MKKAPSRSTRGKKTKETLTRERSKQADRANEVRPSGQFMSSFSPSRSSPDSTFHQFYHVLKESLPMNDSGFRKLLFHDLDIQRFTVNQLQNSRISRQDKARYFLDNVIESSVTSGDGSSFDKLIRVMKNSEYSNLQELAETIQGKLTGEEVNPQNEFLNYLAEAKKKNMVVRFKHIKVLLSGSAAAGKSSFCRLLFGEEFIPNHIRTEIMETKQGLTMDKKTKGNVQQEDQRAKGTEETDIETVKVMSYNMLNETKWIKLDPKNQLGQIKTLLKNRMFHVCKSESELSVPQENESIVASVTDKQLTDMDEKITESPPLPDYSELQEPIKMITVLDSGGQPEYIALLPAINTMPTINFVVHDLTKNLEDRVQVVGKHEEAPEDLLNYSYFDLIKLFMCLITDSESFRQRTIKSNSSNPEQTTQGARISKPEKSYIGFIGTHYDKIKKDDEKLHEINEKLKHFTKNITNLNILPSGNSKIIHPVDNTKSGNAEEGSEIKSIRCQVQELTDEMDDRELPITWMILELEMQELRIKGKKYIPYDQYKDIALKGMLANENEVETSLRHFHVLGIVLCYRDSRIHDVRNMVIIDLQWLFTKLAKIMHLSAKDFKSTTDHNLITTFHERKLLAKKIVKNIQLENTEPKEIQYCIQLLYHLKIIANVIIKRVDYYYLSCALPSTMQYNDGCIFLLSEPLLIRFPSGYLPRGFFCSLVALLLDKEQWEPQLDSSSTKHYSNVITFKLPDETFLRLHDKLHYLEVQVRHYTMDVNIYYHSKILPLLKDCLNDVCHQLQLQFYYEGIQYGFMCHADSNKCNHMAIWKSDKPLKLKCSGKPSHETWLERCHQLWFEENNVSLQYCDQSAPTHSIVPNPAKRVKLDAAEDILIQKEPILPDLLTYLEDVVDWYKFGAYLLPPEHHSQLGVIRKTERENVDECKRALYELYFKVGDKSWNTIIEALQKANYPHIADKIRKDFC